MAHDIGLELSTAFWWATILLLKLATFGTLVGFNRIKRKVFANAEDTKRGGEVKFNDVVIERFRRAHLNDMENIIPFIGLIIVFAATGSGTVTQVSNTCMIFTAARFLHTFVYLYAIRQPARALSFFVGVACNVYLAFKILYFLY